MEREERYGEERYGEEREKRKCIEGIDVCRIDAIGMESNETSSKRMGRKDRRKKKRKKRVGVKEK